MARTVEAALRTTVQSTRWNGAPVQCALVQAGDVKGANKEMHACKIETQTVPKARRRPGTPSTDYCRTRPSLPPAACETLLTL